MSRAERMFNALEKESTTPSAGTPPVGLTEKELQSFENRLTHNMSDKLEQIREQMAGMIDEKLNKAMNKNEQPAQEQPTETAQNTEE